MNTAGRLLSIYDRLMSHGQGSDASMLKVWAEVFNLPSNLHYTEDEVVTCLQAVRSELGLLHAKLTALGVPEDLMQPGMTRLRSLTSTTNINAGWSQFRGEASLIENRLAFAWANWTLSGQDEEDMPANELAALQSELDALETSLNDISAMSPYLKDFTQRQINVIRAALRLYQIQGVKPVEVALNQVAGAYTVEKSRVEAEQAKASDEVKTVFARASAFIEKTAKIADNLDKIKKAGETLHTLAANISPLLTWTQNQGSC